MTDRRMAWTFFLLFWTLSLWGRAAGAQSAAPVKIAVEPRAQSISIGQTAQVTIRLKDVDNRFVAAPKPFTVSVEIQPPTGPAQTRSVTLGVGQSGQSLSLDLPQPGIVRLSAKESELREGAALINVRSQRLTAQVTEAAVEAESTAPLPADPAGGGATPPAPQPQAVRREPHFRMRPGGSQLLLLTPPVAPPAPPLLTLLVSPTTSLLADGKDAATVTAFLSRPAEQDTVLNLFSSGGRLSQSELKFPKGEDTATCTLTSLRAGDIQVRYLGSDPPVALDPAGQKTLTVQFAPPIIDFAVRPSPSAVSLLDRAYFDVQLLDEQSRPIAADTERKVCFVMDNGNGEITPVTLSIPPGSFESRAIFVPDWLGPVEVTASMPSMLNKSARIEVNLPLLLPMLSILGGLLGGGIAYLFGRDRKLKLWRIALGGVTGVVFFWMCLYFGLGRLAHTVVLNPFSVCILSVLGGWFGTAVFDAVGKKLNLPSSERPVS